MKNQSLVALAVAATIFSACNSNRDAKSFADSINESKDSLHSKKVYNDYVLSGPDAKFAVDAYNGSMAEMELGQLAQDKATNAAVKEFGATMIADHGKAREELKLICDAHKIKVPTTISSDFQKIKEELAGKDGADFDKAYVDAMVKDHEEDIEAFKRAQNVITYDDLSGFNKKTLPVLNHHLEMIKKIKEQLK